MQTCLTCHQQTHWQRRGTCRRCYNTHRQQVRLGATTWAILAALGYIRVGRHTAETRAAWAAAHPIQETNPFLDLF